MEILSEVSLNDPSIRGLATNKTDPQEMGEDQLAAYSGRSVGTNSLQEQVEEVLYILTPRERKVLHLRWGFDRGGRSRTLAEVGREIGRSRSTVGRIEKAALVKLKHPSKEYIS